MAEPPRDPDASVADPPRGPGTTPPPRPRWLKVSMIVALVIVVVGVILLVTVGGHGPGRHGSNTQPSTVGTTDVAGEPADASDADRTVEVTTLDAMTFEPSTIDVSAGETVTFVVTNAGQAVHEFTLGNAAMQEEHAEAMAHIPAGMGHDTPNSITLQPGETKHLTWRFGDGGTLEYACHQPGHYRVGMHGDVTVG